MGFSHTANRALSCQHAEPVDWVDDVQIALEPCTIPPAWRPGSFDESAVLDSAAKAAIFASGGGCHGIEERPPTERRRLTADAGSDNKGDIQ